jgi:hypothetical protein
MNTGVFIRSAVVVASLCAVPTAIATQIDRPFFRANSVVIVIGATDDDTSGGVAPVVVGFNLLTSAPNTRSDDIIGVDGYVMNSQSGWVPGLDFSAGTSRLQLQNQTSGGAFSNSGDPDYLEVTDSYTAFGLDGTTDITTPQHRKVSRFLVASNAKFDVYAQASNLTKTDDFSTLDYKNIGIRIRLNVKGGTGAGRWGDMAQNPRIGGTGLDPSINDLGDLSGVPVKVFDGGRRTAADPGTLLEQAVSFNIRYALSPDADSSNINAYDFSMGIGNIGAEVAYTIYTP